jgi:hypothetical protein
MVGFWMRIAFIVFCFTAGCGENAVSSDADVVADVWVRADEDINTGIDASAASDGDTDEDDDGTVEDSFQPTYPDIAGVWTAICQSDLIREVNFNLNFFFFQDGTSIRGVEGESEDAYCHGTVLGDGQVFLTMEEPCTGSTVTFTGNVAGPTLMNGRYFWEWVDAYGTPGHDEGVWYANPSPEYCSPYPNVAGEWALTYRNGRVEYTTITVEQTDNAIRGQSPDGCEYLGAFSLTSECDEFRVYRRCPALPEQTQVLFGILENPDRMSGSWYSMNNTFGCPEIRNGGWLANRL